MGKARVQARRVAPSPQLPPFHKGMGGGRGGRRTMFFRVGETTDHPAQEGDDGGLAPGPQAGALFPLKDRVLLEGILVT